MAGEDVALPGQSPFAAGQKALSHIPHIHEIISAANGKGQPSGKKGFGHRGEAPALHIARTDDAGGEYDAGIQPLGRCVQDQIGGSGLALGVIAVHKPRGEFAILRNEAALGLFRYGVNGADIDHFSYIVGYTLPEDPPCPAHIDLVELGAGPGCNGDDACTVNHAGAAISI